LDIASMVLNPSVEIVVDRTGANQLNKLTADKKREPDYRGCQASVRVQNFIGTELLEKRGEAKCKWRKMQRSFSATTNTVQLLLLKDLEAPSGVLTNCELELQNALDRQDEKLEYTHDLIEPLSVKQVSCSNDNEEEEEQWGREGRIMREDAQIKCIYQASLLYHLTGLVEICLMHPLDVVKTRKHLARIMNHRIVELEEACEAIESNSLLNAGLQVKESLTDDSVQLPLECLQCGRAHDLPRFQIQRGKTDPSSYKSLRHSFRTIFHTE
ncbi:Mitochondrial 2-oxodicarboxylate carrier, partial [Varanus komodoensis]